MLSISQVLSSSTLYKQAFEQGISTILQNRTAGTFILACANIFQHPEMFDKNRQILRDVYQHIENYYNTCRIQNQRPDDSADDITVMEKILEIGLDNLEPLQSRRVETADAVYQLSFNQLRSFRPERMSTASDITLNTPFQPDGFHFNKPFLRKEIFSEGEYKGRHISLLYNKFPFVRYHALLVADKSQQHNQYLSKDYLDYIFELQTSTQKMIPELVVTYNSLGAGASVNHLHFQVFLEASPLPLFSEKFIHNGGTVPYPAPCIVFTDIDHCWGFIQELHKKNTPFNLLFKAERLYCLPRKITSGNQSGINLSMSGWSEIAGTFTMSKEDVFKNITAEELSNVISILGQEI